MNTRKLAFVATAALGLTGGLAHADGWHRGWNHDWRDDAPRYARDRDDDRDDWRGVDYARVLEVTPLMERVRYGEPVRECYDVQRVERMDRGPDRVGATVAGGLLGAVIGHQFGGGSGRHAATLAGAVIGGAIANDAAGRAQARDDYYGPRERVSYGEECRVREQERVEERVRAYRVAYRYHGRDYVTELPYDPGARLRVAVDARPL